MDDIPWPDDSWPAGPDDKCFICGKPINPTLGSLMIFPEPEGPELMCFECIGKLYIGVKKKREQEDD